MKRKMSIRTIALLLAALMLLGCVGPITAGAEETWQLTDDTGIFLVETADDCDLSDQVLTFAAALAEKVTEEELRVASGDAEKAGGSDILLVLDSGIAEQGYEITVSGGQVTVAASDAAGLMYGCNSLIRQLMANDCVVNTASAPDVAERALMLDIGRKYYSVDWIKEMIRELAWADMNALVLHFSEEMGLGIESKLYTWLNGRDGTLCTQAEVETDNRYLTQEEVAEIVEYAQTYHVQIIPSFDSPGHMNYIVKKFNEQCADADYSFDYDGKTYTAEAGSEIGNYYHYNNQTSIVKGSRNTAYSRGIDISNEVAVAFTKSLIEEYATLFADLGCTKFDIGGDELLGWGSAIVSDVKNWQQLDHWKEYAQNRAKEEGLSNWSSAVAYDGFMYYMNDLYDLVTSLDYESVRMWNDDAFRSSDTGWTGVVDLNTGVEILYWSSGSNKVSTYVDPGHGVYNYLENYNYYILGKTRPTAQLVYESWSPYNFSSETLSVGDGAVLGSAFCIWCDNPSAEDEETVMTEALPRIRANGAKAWDADTEVSYDDFAANWDTVGDAPSAVSEAEIWVIPDYTGLEAAIAEYEAVDPAPYTEDSYAACTAAAEEAETLMAGKPSQEEVDAAAAAIRQAIEDLELIPTLDTTELTAAIDEYDTVDSSLYTGDSFEMYTAAVEDAKTLLEGTPSQEEVDAALALIQTRKEALWELENVSDVSVFISGSFKSSKVYVGKTARMQMSLVKGAPVKGFAIYNDLNTETVISKQTVSTTKSDRDNYSVTFKPTKAEKGKRTYTVYAILEDGTLSADCLTMSVTIK